MISTPFVSVPPRTYGGTELIIYELVEGLIDCGHQVGLFATGDSLTRAALYSLYPEAKWPPDPMADLNHLSWALTHAVEIGFDLIHVHSAAALAMARLMRQLPMVYTIHHDREEPLSEFYQHFPQTQFIAISHNQRRLERPLPRCEVIHHGLEVERFACTDEPGEYVCFVGRLSEVKGPHIAVDVARDAGLPIRVAGEVHPPDRAFAEKELNGRLALPHVTQLGCIGLAQKVPLLRDARALLAPLQWEEPFGLIMIEAMLSGCPVVAFPRGSAPELIEGGVTGFLVASPGEMAEVIRKGGLVDSIDRRRCRERARQRFSRTRMVREHLQIYARALAQDSWANPEKGKPVLDVL